MGVGDGGWGSWTTRIFFSILKELVFLTPDTRLCRCHIGVNACHAPTDLSGDRRSGAALSTSFWWRLMGEHCAIAQRLGRRELYMCPRTLMICPTSRTHGDTGVPAGGVPVTGKVTCDGIAVDISKA